MRLNSHLYDTTLQNSTIYAMDSYQLRSWLAGFLVPLWLLLIAHPEGTLSHFPLISAMECRVIRRFLFHFFDKWWSPQHPRIDVTTFFFCLHDETQPEWNSISYFRIYASLYRNFVYKRRWPRLRFTIEAIIISRCLVLGHRVQRGYQFIN